MHLVAIGGSDAGISAALRARELDPQAEVTVVVADAYPNFSICGIPYYVSGEVTHWRNLAHRTIADLEATGMQLRLDTTARRIEVSDRKLLITDLAGAEQLIAYDKLLVGTGAVPVQPPIEGLRGPGALGPGDGVHLLHSMGDTFALMRTLEETGTTVTRVSPAADPSAGRLCVSAVTTGGEDVVCSADLVLVVAGVRPDSELAAAAGATLGARNAIAVDRQMNTGLPGHRTAAGRPAVRPPARRGGQAHRHRRHRHLPWHDRRRDERSRPVLHPAAGQPVGRGANGSPGMGEVRQGPAHGAVAA